MIFQDDIILLMLRFNLKTCPTYQGKNGFIRPVKPRQFVRFKEWTNRGSHSLRVGMQNAQPLWKTVPYCQNYDQNSGHY